MIKKLQCIFFLLLPLLSFGQTCDTLYSHEKYIERKVEINYRNCHQIRIDSTYTIVQWTNVDSNYLVPRFSENICYSLFHSLTGALLQEQWQGNDTVYFKSYYSTGNLKSFVKSVYKREPYYFHDQIEKYFDNGQLWYKGEYKSSSFSTHTSYYPDGSVESVAKRFSYNPNPFGEYVEYFPNGQVSMLQKFSEPDTTTNQYQNSTLLSEKFYTESGMSSEQNLNEYKALYIGIYPPTKRDTYIDQDIFHEEVYSHLQFTNHEAYSNDMQILKDKIVSNLKFSNKLYCNKGVAWISLIISKEGVIELDEVQLENEELRKCIEQSINKIKSWPAASLNEEHVNTYVYTFLIIDK